MSFIKDEDVTQAMPELSLLLSDELGELPKPKVSKGFPVPFAPDITPCFLFDAFDLEIEKLECAVKSLGLSLCRAVSRAVLQWQ